MLQGIETLVLVYESLPVTLSSIFLGPSTASKKKNVHIVVITVPLSIAIMFLVGVSVFLQRFRGGCLRNQVV